MAIAESTDMVMSRRSLRRKEPNPTNAQLILQKRELSYGRETVLIGYLLSACTVADLKSPNARSRHQRKEESSCCEDIDDYDLFTSVP